MHELQRLMIPLDVITVGERMRPLDPKFVRKLVAMINTVGLINNIVVWETPEGGYKLIDGLHRLEACRLIGKSEIRATVARSKNDNEAKALEIELNLFTYDNLRAMREWEV